MTVEHDELVQTLVVERFTRWLPDPDATDRRELADCPTTRDGMPFEPLHPVRARRRHAAAASLTRRAS